MNPSHVMKDAEVVLEYAKEKYMVPPSEAMFSSLQSARSRFNESGTRDVRVKVLLHGISLGAMSAAYVAMKSNFNRELPVDFVFLDRTFGSLD